ncbi:unnamed protein product [Linum trigynum]|uniref:Reverse transcriptase zinc-binding domain-containing protein n=1 Tax=Linum trigynum TaxID=586398 RepID=A0AAV2CFN3_9ROSI
MQMLIRSWPTGDPSSWLDWFTHLFLHAFTWEVWKERNGRSFNDTKHTWQTIFVKIGRNLLRWISATGLISEHNSKEWLRLLFQACPSEQESKNEVFS